jgi:competence protein ComEC
VSLFRADVVETVAVGGRSPYRLTWAEARVLLLATALWGVALAVTERPPTTSVTPLWGAGLLRDFSNLLSPFGDGGDLLPGLVFGDETGLSKDVSEAMLTSALSHLTAVSGANCAIWAAAVSVLLRVRWVRWRWRIVLQLGAVWGFATLVGLPPTVLRAAALLSVVGGVRLLGRGTHPLVGLAWGCLGLLVPYPAIARSFSFQLSVAATAGIILLAGPIDAWSRRWLPSPLAGVLSVTVAAQMGCLPLLLSLGQPPTLGGVLSNALAAVAVPVASVSGIAALLLLWCPPLAALAAVPGVLAAGWIVLVARFFSVRPLGRIPWPEGSAGLICAVAALAAVGVLTQLGRRSRMLLGGCVAVVLLVVTVGTAARQLRADLSFPRDPFLVFCDVGQGDGWVARAGSQVVLIDTGPEPKAIDSCLRILGIREITVLVLTHFDADHVGGAAGVVRRGRSIGELWVSGRADPRLEELETHLHPARVRVVRAGERGTLGALDWEALWPLREPSGEVGNDASLVLRLSSGGMSVLGLGDTGAEEQRRIRQRGAGADVVKVGHHGSADHDPVLLSAASTRLAVISVGRRNRYGHPAPHLLRSLAGIGTVRTDRDGTVVVSQQGELWCSRGCHGLTVQ